MQTILGAGGAIGIPLAKSLTSYTSDTRLVGRNPKKVNPDDQCWPADITNPTELDKAVEGSDVVYLVAGLPYKARVWLKYWPPLMQNLIESCQKHNAKLVFFDNMYMYDPRRLSCMTEDTTINPCSKKGLARAEVASMLTKAMDNIEITALIARAPDFLGLHNSILNEIVLKKLLKGQKANWFISDKHLHQFIWDEDAARATAQLGNTEDAYQQIWHLPTDQTPRTGKDWIKLVASQLGKTPRYSVLPKAMVSLAGIFSPTIREIKEMTYQFESDYVFKSDKFEQKFKWKATPSEQAIAKVIKKIHQ